MPELVGIATSLINSVTKYSTCEEEYFLLADFTVARCQWSMAYAGTTRRRLELEAIQQIAEHECVLVLGATRKLTGIVTTADVNRQFAQLGEPFLLLGQIENHVRDLIANIFTKAELAGVRDPPDSGREIEDVSI